ncbi:MAG: response regulator [Kiritimatiellia bacterium]
MAKILIVDDEIDVLETLSVLLRSEGHEVVPVSEGMEAMKKVRSMEHFDLLVSDIRMAPIDGIELLEYAKKDRPAMGIVIISAYLDEETIRRAEELGCTHYIRKPFKLDDVIFAIHKVLGEHL